MKLRLYWSYATRSLARNGQRTLLAIFCVAVGVLAIVSLELVGGMIGGAISGNVRDTNGGDVQVRSDVTPLTQRQLQNFDALQSQGVITAWTAATVAGAQTYEKNGDVQFYSVGAINTATFHLVDPPTFLNPSGDTLSQALVGNNAVATQQLLQQLGAHVGDDLNIETTDGRTLNVHIAAEIATSGEFNSALAIVSLDTYAAAASTSGLPVTYTVVYANVPGGTAANQDTAKKDIGALLPRTRVTTVNDAIQSNKDSVQNITYFLQIVGLLALLIGGVGIINTMQVLLRRRRTEIAMLKTAGYRQADLYGLFGLEAGLLGLIGGIIGAAAGIGVSFILRAFVENAFFIHLPAQIDAKTVLLGAVIGFATALIFGIMPIVQASRVRPIAVLRELPEGAGGASVLLSIGLGVLVAVLYFLLAAIILGNASVAIFAVGGTGIFLLLLSLFFTLVVLIISKLPVLERFTWWYLLLIVGALAVSALLTIVVPGFGILLLAVSVFGLLIVILPRAWKVSFRMALRNIGRQKARTVTTLVALFIGLFVIGTVVALGQNIQDKIASAVANQVTYNSYVIAGTNNRSQVDAALRQVGGIQKQQTNILASGVPLQVNGIPLDQILAATTDSSEKKIGKDELLSYLSAVSGFDLAHGSVPDVKLMRSGGGNAGTNLTAADAGTNAVLVSSRAAFPPLNLKVGDTITIGDQNGEHPVTLTVKGFYTDLTIISGALYTDNSVALSVSGGHPFYAYSLKIDPAQATQKLQQIRRLVPSVQTFNLADFLNEFVKILDNFVGMITAIASLTLLAGLIIIANAVALAMLERRRELGILKAVGYTSRSVLGEVLVENGIVGFTGGVLAMLLVTLFLTVIAKAIFKTDLGVGAPLVLLLVAGAAVISMVVAAAVAYQSTRVRPLEVLRYE
jgi:predicted lysophospholipase L1 biosynthesis ABC-type transport system permease subunit